MEKEYKIKIKENLNKTLGSSLIPELGQVKKGKVRDVYFTKDKLVMIASDRVSSFDFVLDNLIPYKGIILNKFAKWAFDNTKDIIKNAVVESPDPNIFVQKKLKNIGVECVVRGYVWGSMAAAYEDGERDFCGIKLPSNLLRYQKLKEPLFTPTTKAEKGHDENMKYKDVEKLLGKKLAKKVRDTALALYKRGEELAQKNGYIFIDTKYEFGTDSKGELYLIDEANTPDSSRFCELKEWEAKFKKIQSEIKKSKFENVSILLEKKKDLKIKEHSKQYVRDVLIESGFDPKKSTSVPKLNQDQVIETSYRYIQAYENITGEKFDFNISDLDPQKRIINNLQKAGMIDGGCVIILAGSNSDKPHIEKIQEKLNTYKIPSIVRICSAHKQPGKLEELLKYYNQSLQPLLIIGVAGGTDALSGTASFHSVHPVISCPPDGMNETCLTNPPGSSNAFIKRPDNAAKFAAQMFSNMNFEIKQKIIEINRKKIESLENADMK